MSPDQAIDGFARAVEALGKSLLPTTSPEDVAAVRDAIAPLRLPRDLERFWERVAPFGLGIDTRPELIGSDESLLLWRQTRDEFPDAAPPVLLEFATETHCSLLIELMQPGVVGGAIFECELASNRGFRRVLNSFSDWLAFMTDALAGGRFCEHVTRGGAHLPYVPSPWFSNPELAPVPPPHPDYGEKFFVERSPDRWPEHWQIPWHDF